VFRKEQPDKMYSILPARPEKPKVCLEPVQGSKKTKHRLRPSGEAVMMKDESLLAGRSRSGLIAMLFTFVGRVLYWAGWPGIHLILRSSERTRVILLSDDKRCLVVRQWLGDGAWKLPGGGISRGEKPVMAAVRELREELGVHIDARSLTFIQGTDINEHGHVYGAQLFGAYLGTNQPLTLRSWELAEAAWIDLDEALMGITDPQAQEAVRLWANTAICYTTNAV